jgi:glycosyltransferase 2 family protein
MLGAHQGQQTSRGWWLVLLRWFAALLILAVLVHFLPLRSLRAAMEQVPFTRFLVILCGYLLAHCLGIVKWRMVVNTAGAQLSFASSAQCYTGGLFGTLFLPSIIGGDMIRLAVGLRRSPHPAAVLAGNVVDRLLDVGAQAGLVLLGLIFLPAVLPEQFAAAGKKTLLFGAITFAGLALVAFSLRRVLLAGRSIRFRRRLARLRRALRSVSGRPHVLLLGWIMATAIQTSFLLLSAQLAAYCGLSVPLRVWLFAWPLAKVAAILPLTQGGIGVREAALVALLAPFGAPGPLVLAAGLIWEAVVIAGGLLAGAVALALNRSQVPAERPAL